MPVDEDKKLPSVNLDMPKAGQESRAARGSEAEKAALGPGSRTRAETQLLQRFFGGKTLSDLYIFLNFLTMSLFIVQKNLMYNMVTVANIAVRCIGKFLRVNPDFSLQEKKFFVSM